MARQARVGPQRRAAARSRRAAASSRRRAPGRAAFARAAASAACAVRDGLDLVAPAQQARERTRACRRCRPPAGCAPAAVRSEAHCPTVRAARCRRRRAAPRRRSADSPSGSQRSASSTKALAPTAVEARLRAAPIRSAGRCAEPSGIDTVKVVPWPSTLAARTVPPCSFTSSCTSARPMPLPSWVRPRAPSTRWKRSKMRGSSLGRNADAGVAHGELDRVARLAGARPRSRPRR